MLREMMLFHAGEFEDPMEKRTAMARAMLDADRGQGALERTRFSTLVREEVARMTDRDLWYLFHDELADVYEPVYLHQFKPGVRRNSASSTWRMPTYTTYSPRC